MFIMKRIHFSVRFFLVLCLLSSIVHSASVYNLVPSCVQTHAGVFLLLNIATGFLAFATAATVHDSAMYVPVHLPQLVISFADDLTLSPSNQFELFDSKDFIYAINVSFDTTLVTYPDVFTTRLVFSTCSSNTDFDTILTVFDSQDDDTVSEVDVTSIGAEGGLFVMSTNDMNCNMAPMLNKAASQVYERSMTVLLDDLLVYAVIDGFNGEEGQFHLTVMDCGTTCVEYDHSGSCQCALCAEHYVLDSTTHTCMVAACDVTNAQYLTEQRPECVCQHGYLGELILNQTEQEWRGTCVANCSLSSDDECALWNREICSNTPHTCGPCLQGFTAEGVNSGKDDGNGECNKCFDDNCVVCSDVDEGSCTYCGAFYALINGACSPCDFLTSNWAMMDSITGYSVDREPVDGDYFGMGVALQYPLVLIGAPYEDGTLSNVGYVHIMQHTQGDSSLEHVFDLSPTDSTAFLTFGYIMRMTDRLLVVSQYATNCAYSRVYVFTREGDYNFSLTFTLNEDPNDNTVDCRSYGDSIDLYNTTIIVGETGMDVNDVASSGGAHIYEETTPNVWERVHTMTVLAAGDSPRTNDFCGTEVAIADDVALMSCYLSYAFESEAGAIYVSRRKNGEGWAYDTRVLPEQAATFFFGYAEVLLLNDASLIVTSSVSNAEYHNGRVHVIQSSITAGWIDVNTLRIPTEYIEEDEYGRFGSAIAADDSMLVVGCPYCTNLLGTADGGLVFVYAFDHFTGATSYVHVFSSPSTDSHLFGNTHAIAVEAGVIVVGAGGDDTYVDNGGSVYMFQIDCQPPVVTSCPSDILSLPNSIVGSDTVTWEIEAYDVSGTDVRITCDPSTDVSYVFPINQTTPVSCAVTDNAGNFVYCNFSVIVLNDNDPPFAIECPAYIFKDASSNLANFHVNALDVIDPMPTPYCTYSSSKVFPNDGNEFDAVEFMETETIVTCFAVDWQNNSNPNVNCSFPVSIDMDPPALWCPASMRYYACETVLDSVALNISVSDESDFTMWLNVSTQEEEEDENSIVKVTVMDAHENVANCEIQVYSRSCMWSQPSNISELHLFCPPVIYSNTIRRADQVNGSSFVTASSTRGDTIAFSGEHFYFEPSEGAHIYFANQKPVRSDEFYVEAHVSDDYMTISCEIPAVQPYFDDYVQYWTYTMRPHPNHVGNAECATVNTESSDMFHYPVVPQITAVQGCDDDDAQYETVNCPTRGSDVRLTILGFNLAFDMDVTVDAIPCEHVQYMSEEQVNITLTAANMSQTLARTGLTCELPASVGVSSAVVATQKSEVSLPFNGVSYALPQIETVTGCDVNTESSTLNCPQDALSTPTELTITGRHFGAHGALVYIGSHLASSVSHDVDFPHEILTCMLPSGAGTDIAVMVVQGGGQASIALNSTVSYERCPSGYFANGALCDACLPGTYTDTFTSQASCADCPVGTFNAFHNASFCSNCESGKYQPDPTQGYTICQDCEAGRYTDDTTVKYVCTECSTGTFQPAHGQSACEACPGGKYINERGWNMSCLECAPGSYSLTGQSECSPCVSAFEFAPFPGSDTCISCPANSVATVDDVSCECNAGYYDTMEQYSDDIPVTCVVCPDEYDCPVKVTGLTLITLELKEGYWRSSAESIEAFQCFSVDSCHGGTVTNVTNTCQDHRMGPLCALCEPGYVASSYASPCEKCLAGEWQILLLIVAMLAAIVFCIWYVRRTMQKSHKEKGDIGTLFKILMSGFQLNMIALSFSFHWEQFFGDFMATESAVSSVGTSSLNLACLLDFSSSSAAAEDDTWVPFYVETFLFAITLGIVVVCPLFVLLPYYIHKIERQQALTWSEAKDNLIRIYQVAVPVIFFLMHPTLCERTMQLFHCTEVDHVLYLTQQMDQECWKGAHLVWTLTCGLAMLAIYVIGIPVAGFVLLYSNRDKIHPDHPDHHEFHEKYSFLYKGYDVVNKPVAFGWELVVTARKVLLLGVSVYFTNNPPVQVLIGLLIIVIAFFLHAFVLPYEHANLNMAEFASLFTSFVTFYLGQFTFLDKTYLSKAENHLLSWIALGCNVLFIAVMIGFFTMAARKKGEKMLNKMMKKSTDDDHDEELKMEAHCRPYTDEVEMVDLEHDQNL